MSIIYMMVLFERGAGNSIACSKDLGMRSGLHDICESYLGGLVFPSRLYLDIKESQRHLTRRAITRRQLYQNL